MVSKKHFSPIVFTASILCFLFPFITVSCGGQRTILTGAQLALGTTVSQPQLFGSPQQKKIDPEPLATLVFIGAIVGLTVSLSLGKRSYLTSAISGGLAALCLLLLKSKMDQDVVQQGHGLIQLNYEVGFSLALASLILGACWNAYAFSSRSKATPQDVLPKSTAAGG